MVKRGSPAASSWQVFFMSVRRNLFQMSEKYFEKWNCTALAELFAVHPWLWVWFLRANHPSCSDPLKNASTSPRCHVPPQTSGLEIKGCISGSGSRCPSSRHGLCNGPLMAATNDQQPEALPPETVGHRLLTSTDSVCSSMLRERIVCDGDSARAGSLRRLSKLHSFWDGWMSVCLATHSSPDGDYNCLCVQMCCGVSISV